MNRAITISMLVASVAAACSTSGSACEEARSTTITSMVEICAETGYSGSKFCRRCVDSGYFSTTGASVCQCKHLSFDADFCSYSTNGDAKAKVRNAVDWADSVCADFAPPSAILPAEDAGDAGDASIDASTDGAL